MSKRKRHILAVLAAAEVFPPANHDITTSDVMASFGHRPSRCKVVTDLHKLAEWGYVRQGRTNVVHSGCEGGEVISWYITTTGLRAALGATL